MIQKFITCLYFYMAFTEDSKPCFQFQEIATDKSTSHLKCQCNSWAGDY